MPSASVKRAALAVCAAFLAASAGAQPARAHAELLRSTPSANARLAAAPALIELYFSEPLEPGFSQLEVLNSEGARVDNADARLDPADDSRLIASVRSLPAGIYTVAWQVLSAVDGHVTSGAFPFAIGSVDEGELAALSATQSARVAPADVIARWATFVASAMLVGLPMFLLAVWRDTEPAGPWRRLAAAALALLLWALVLGWLAQAERASGAEAVAPWGPAAREMLIGTRYGSLWLGRLALALILISVWRREPAARSATWAALALALALVLSLSLNSHAAADSAGLTSLAVDWTHSIAALAWAGGLMCFVAGLWTIWPLPGEVRLRHLRTLIPRFSALALVSVGTLAATGVYMAILRVGSWAALTDTTYGQVLLVKLALGAAMVGLGAFNLLVVGPGLRQPAREHAIAAIFRRTVAGEAGLAAALLLSVGLLTALPPARPPEAPALRLEAAADDLKLRLAIAPGRIGLNTFTLTVQDTEGLVADAGEVQLRFTPQTRDLAPSRLQLESLGDGRYEAPGAYLSLPDSWQVQAVVRREGRFDAFANFLVEVDAEGSSSSVAWPRVGGGLIWTAALGAALAFWSLTGRRVIALLPAASLALAGWVVWQTPADVRDVGPINPIPPNVDSINLGRDLFAANCAPCHGSAGKGDGPVGLTLNPRPADLSLHAVPGVHTDGRLYLWISDGFPGSVMPAFRDTLSDHERWHIVNFIRTLAPQ